MRKPVLIIILLITWIAIGLCFYLVLHKDASQNGTSDADSAGSGGSGNSTNVNFVTAASRVTPGVVHIKSTFGNAEETAYGGRAVSQASGSGVLIDKNGYIATNNHVVENATQMVVVLPDRREFEAKLVGRDPNTDLALLKINARDLPIVKFGNSDNVRVGEWVLAVGYPYSLNTTATAGIISAKGRNIGIISQSPAAESPNQGSHAIESFLQTDAAINPGNSGGALVNLNGELIGINAAIASYTGSYAGYAFAIPANLAKKILDDFKKYGRVNRGVLGVNFPSPATEDQFLRAQGIQPGTVKGVFITDIQSGSAAAAAGLKGGDIIQMIDSTQIYSSTEFSERMARHRPGDKLSLTYLRNGKKKTASVTLKEEKEQPADMEGNEAVQAIFKKLGAQFSPLPAALKERLNINAGVIVTEVYEGGIFERIGVPAKTVIVYINGRKMQTPADVGNALIEAQNSSVQILAIAPDGSKVAFSLSLGV
jgi:serine protease Do